MIYDDNLNVIKDRFPEIYEALIQLKNNDIESNIVIETAKNGEPIIKYIKDGKEIYLNSRYNSSNEAEKYIEKFVDMPDEAVLLMFGLSNASYVRAYLSKNTNKNYCLVYEPDLSLFVKVIEKIDITDILKNYRIRLFVEGINENLFEYYTSNSINNANIMTSKIASAPKYDEVFGDKFECYIKKIKDIFLKIRVGSSTAEMYGKRVCQNNIMNMAYLPGSRSVMDFCGKIPENTVAVLVSAGPSLENNIELLKEIKGKALIMVVDTAISKVMARGIMPDFIISIDFAKELKLFQSKGLDEVAYIADMDNNYEAIDMVKPKDLIFASCDSLLWNRMFSEEESSVCTIESGGSVATSAIANLINWGIKKIILIGQDLALTNNKIHIGDEEKEFDEDSDDYLYVKGIKEDRVLTRKDYYIYLRWIENIAARFPEIKIIDATEGGAYIENTQVMTFREAIDNYCINNTFDVNEIIQSVPKLFNDKKKIVDELIKLRHDLENLKRESQDIVRKVHNAYTMLCRNEYNVTKLRKINASMEKYDEKYLSSEMYIYIIKCISGEENQFSRDLFIEEKDEIKEAIRMYKKSEKYYNAIAEKIPEIQGYIDDCLKKMKEDE